MNPTLDLNFVRQQFPAFSEPSLVGKAFFENAGGSYTCAQVIEGVPIDPVDPPRPMEMMRRTESEIARWWRRPYVVTTAEGAEVWCLSQDSHRSRCWGTCPTVEAAVSMAQERP